MEKLMMKRMALLLLVTCVPVYGNLANDGFLTEGEHEWLVTWSNYQVPLIVDGGGAYRISVRDNGRLIVKSTSTPLSMDGGGVYDILLGNNAHLLYLDGATEFIGIGGNATAVLMGGSINLIRSGQYTITTGTGPHIDLFCQPGWSWILDNPMLGIQGEWMDGSPFRIQFINDATYDPVWTNINVIIPEPATLMLFGIGGILFRRKMGTEHSRLP
jgi:hypothetical protein